MHKTLIKLLCFLIALTVSVSAQGRKAGLWEMTTKMTLQQSPYPATMTSDPATMLSSPFGRWHNPNLLCVTQASLDKYNAIVTPNHKHNECRVTNVVKSANGMTGDLVCTGRMSGKATMQATWEDSEHTTESEHFVGTMMVGPNARALEWTRSSTSVFKSTDCGDVTPTTF